MPNTIADNLSRLVSARSNIASAIISKGGSVGANDGFEAFPAAISAIPSGDIYEVTQEDWNLAKEYIEGTLEEITLNIEGIQSAAFLSYSLLQSVNFPNCTYIGSSAFWDCASLQSVSFPVCTTIGSNAFYSCKLLQSVSFPACTTIGSNAFQYCTSLQSVSFPVCTYIGQNAFLSCKLLQSVIFPNCSVIGGSGFYLCTSLSKIILLYSGVCTLSYNNAFYCTPISDSSYLGYFGSIYVPFSLVDSYKTATNWSDYANRIIGIDRSDINESIIL